MNMTNVIIYRADNYGGFTLAGYPVMNCRREQAFNNYILPITPSFSNVGLEFSFAIFISNLATLPLNLSKYLKPP